MEATAGGEAHRVYGGLGLSDLKRVGKRSLEWDLNDWKWDGDLFIASQLNSARTDGHSQQFFPLGSGIPETGNTSNTSSSCSDEVDLEKEKRELEKRRRVIVVDDDNLNDEGGALSLKLGGHGYPSTDRELCNWEGTSGKKTKLAGVTVNRAVCQVEDCGADLSKGKDYHRRHKVCEMHSKASKALVGNIMQRFCQQCSRFHALQEFDEGKRSCRRRLAGHNKRRRKTHPDAVSGSSLNDEQASGYLLISLLRILSNVQSNKSEQMKDQDLLCHLLKSLASRADVQGKNVSTLLQESNDLPSDRSSDGNTGTSSALLANGLQVMSKATERHNKTLETEMPQGRVHADVRGDNVQIMSSSRTGIQFPIKDSVSAYTEVRDSTVERIKLNNFDLNDTYVDSDDSVEEIGRLPASGNLGAGSLEYPLWIKQDSNQSSPLQTSRQSDSASAQSPSSSSGDAQSRTDRIVFKLFGKEPKDIPVVLRAQILDWLSHSPTDIESYIRPGCIILTVYLRLAESTWEQLCCNLTSKLSRLLEVSDNTFWRTGWLYIRMQNQIAFVYNGQVVADMPLPLKNNNYPKILSIKPIAISATEKAQFAVKGYNLTRPATSILCALEGKYLVQRATSELNECGDILKEDDELQHVNISCSIPTVIGRGFIEIEDHGLGSSFFPFIVAEDDVCSEIRMLETAVDFDEYHEDVSEGTWKIEAKNEAMNFMHEMGWLLHRSHLNSRLGHSDPNSDAFPFKRLRWLMEFSMEHDWCSVVRKLLDVFLEGSVDSGGHSSLMLALSEMNLLHRAVRRNSRPLVDLLLRYAPRTVADRLESNFKSSTGKHEGLLFRPDVVGAAGLTPLHIAAGKDSSEDVLDALTNDPGTVGIAAWKNARDTTGCTPEDYARLRGHYSYIHLIQRKAKKQAPPGQVVLDMAAAVPPIEDDPNMNQKRTQKLATGFEIAKTDLRTNNKQCKLCVQKLAYRNVGRSLAYRPAMLSMVAIAAVCVCVALCFKTQPCTWDALLIKTQ